MAISFFETVIKVVNKDPVKWLGRVNATDDLISLVEALTSPTATPAQKLLATSKFISNITTELAKFPKVGVIAIETSLFNLAGSAKTFNTTPTVQNFAEIISSIGGVLEAVAKFTKLKNLELAGTLLTSYGIVMKTVADGSESIGLGSYYYDLYQAVTQKAAKAEATSYASSLAVLLNPTADKHLIAALIDASKNNDVGIAESVAFLNHFRKLLGMAGEVAPTTPDAVFREVTTILSSTGYQSLKGEVIILAPAKTSAEARDSFGNLLSLVYLTPFSIYRLTEGAENTLKAAHTTLAAQWEADKLLTSQDIADGKANFSDMYLSDRAAMLSWVNKRNATENDNLVMDGPDGVFKDATLNTRIRLGSSSGDTAKPNYVFGSILSDVDLTGGDLNDHIYGGSGNDTLNGGKGNDWLEGGADNDILYGDAGDDWLFGGKANDQLTGGAGRDTLYGGAGTDKYIHNNGDGNDTIIDTDGLGIIQINTGITLNGGAKVTGADQLWESTDKTVRYARSEQGNGKFTLNITLENGEKIFVKDWVNGQLGINLQASTANVASVLSNKSDMFFASNIDEKIDGGEGNDVLIATGRVKTTLLGGMGDDLILGYGNGYITKLTSFPDVNGDRHDVSIVPTGGAHISEKWQTIGGEWLLDPNNPEVIYYLNDSAYLGSYWTLRGNDPDYGVVRYGKSGVGALTTFASLSTPNNTITEVLTGGTGNDLISGSVDADYIDGGNDNDFLIGNSGNDDIFGGQGKDYVFGGNGDDNINGGNEDDELDGGYGVDYLTGGAGSDNLQGDLPILRGTDAPPPSTDFSLMGNDTLDGGAGNDSLSGGGGSNVLLGGEGDDYLHGNQSGNTLGIPEGYQGDDILDGGNGNDRLLGDGGNDTLLGAAGDDMLDGGAGIDNLNGDSGNDRLQGSNDNDILFGGSGVDILFGENGDDKLDGGEGDDELQGGDGNDTLFGGAGIDDLYGNSGNDTYEATSGDAIIDSAGLDTVKLDLQRNQINIFESIELGALILRWGNDADYIRIYNGGAGAIETIQFSDTSINLVSMIKNKQVQGVNVLFLEVSEVRTHGQIGTFEHDSDTLKNTTFLIQNSLMATIVDESGGSADTVDFGADVSSSQATYKRTTSDDLIITLNTGAEITIRKHYVASHRIENFKFADKTILASTLDTLTPVLAQGTIGADNLRGTTGSDQIHGYFGGDYIMGAGGNDGLYGDDGRDSLFGEAGDDTLNGGTDNDELDGGVGVDTMLGGAGDDEYFVDNTGDVVTENLSEGIDIVTSTVNYALSANVENLILYKNLYVHWTEELPLNGTGNNLDNVIGGNRADNVLNGSKGNDWLFGHGGNDTYIFARGDGADTINDTDENHSYVDAGSRDVLQFSNLKSTDITGLIKSGDDLIMQFGTDQITIQGQLKYVSANAAGTWSRNGIDRFKFSDGVVWGEFFNHQPPLLSYYGVIINQTGNASAETLYGGYWSDKIFGGAGNDTILGDQNSEISYSTFSDLYGNDIFSGGTGNDTITGYYGADSYLFAKGDGLDTIFDYGLGVGNLDKVIFSNVKSTEFTVTSNFVIKYGVSDELTAIGVEQYQFSDGVILSDSDMVARAPVNAVNGTTGNDTLTGWRGRDTIKGGTGNDTLVGDTGSDTYIFDKGDGIDSVEEFEGSNILQFTNVKSTEITSVINYSNNLVINYGVSDQITFTGRTYNNFYYGVLNFQYKFSDGVTWTQADIAARIAIKGSSGDDALSGLDDTTNRIYGLDGNDMLQGGNQADTIDGGKGNDTLKGGAGGDTYLVGIGAGTDTIDENYATTGIDIAQFSIKSTAVTAVLKVGDDLVIKFGVADQLTIPHQISAYHDYGYGVEQFKFSDGVVWTQADILARTGNITITGTLGDDLLYGSKFADNFVGGQGNDRYVINHIGDVVTENLNEGIDTLESEVNFTLSANVENFTTFNNSNGIGNALNNTFIGNRGGVNVFSGGAGNDNYTVDNALDVVVENINEGADLVNSGITYTLAANIEKLTLTGNAAINGTGNILNNTLTGNVANNIINGGAGTDTMLGGLGNDTYVVDTTTDVVTEAANAGTDLVQSGATYTLGTNVENLTLTGTIAINGTGNTLKNTLTGNAAANILNGGAGADTMVGGLGSDTYVVDVISDVVTETSALLTEMDTVQAAITFILGANLENLTLTGVATINGTGNASNNTLTGNGVVNILTGGAGNDTLDGGAGADKLLGGLGNDIYIKDNTLDVITENLNEGTDLVNSKVTYTLATNIENLTLTGTGIINATGNTLNNALTGNSVANVLNGGVGLDTMLGGGGNDTYVVDNIGDIVTEAASAGTDLVQSNVTYALAANLENLTLTGTIAINGTGNNLNNTITGNSSANVLNGGAGADTMIGGLGNDTYVVDVASDLVTEATSAGTDTVIAGFTYTLAANMENLILTGTNAINGTGNTLVNLLVGNSGANILAGGTGNDTLTGGAGTDFFVFNTALSSTANKDIISDFSVVDDTIRLENAVFTKFTAAGALPAVTFVSGAGAKALDANDYLVYNSTTGTLSYDADGNGVGAQVDIVTLTGIPALTTADFTII